VNDSRRYSDDPRRRIQTRPSLETHRRQADVLVVAGFVKPGAVVVDVGINTTAEGDLVGDVDTAAVERVAAAVTPVPGGVGPVTTMLLMRHLVTAAERRQGPPGED
jgi:methylenetetrahydrofolate dehydrogenase (NADP+)/methenyltetrahydrofolate cyclohydrolase